MLSRFFIERPIFANVIAIVTMILGVVMLIRLPVEQYPQITPPTVQVVTTYPGANATVLAETVAQPIEQQVNGVENMLYMSSTCSSSGTYTLTVTFDIGTDLDTAQILVENRVAIAEPQLPQEVKQQGVVTQKQSTDIVLIVALTSPDGSVSPLALSNYATVRIKEELSRIDGVGSITVFGSGDYSMRIWLNPGALKARDLTVQDVLKAVQGQNVQVAAGQLGAPPAPPDTEFELTLNVKGRLTEVSEFENIILKTGDNGDLIYLRDVGRVELGSKDYSVYCEKNGQPSAGVAVYQLPGANALNLAETIQAKMVELSKRFPTGLVYDIPFNTTKFVKASIDEVYRTLFEAGFLVLIVILVFLQDWRAVMIPATTVPVTIIGAFVFFAAFGFTVNMLTLFGLILAIGLVVDDAIIIVENAAHHVSNGEDPKNATIRAMDELFGPIIATSMVLMAVFLPSTFLDGIVGQMYRQFALTIAATAVISTINAVTLKPAQCAVYLRPPKKPGIFARTFNRCYDRCEEMYFALIRKLVRWVFATMLGFVALVVLTAWWFQSMPTGFLPIEDQGYLLVSVELPAAASLQRTQTVTTELEGMIGKLPGVEDTVIIGGRSLLDNTSSSNNAIIYIILKDWSERTTSETSLLGIFDNLNLIFKDYQPAKVFALPPPSIPGLGISGGFSLELLSQAGDDIQNELESLENAVVAIRKDGENEPSVAMIQTAFKAGVPQMEIVVDRQKAATLDLELNDVFQTMQGYLGTFYANDFNKFNYTYQVRIQADNRFRNSIQELKRLEVRNRKGDMVPLGTLIDLKRTYGPQVVSRYNLYPAALLVGQASPGYSSGEAMNAMQRLAEKHLPFGSDYAWTAVSYQQANMGSQPIIVFVLAVVMVYLVLAAQYESWASPTAVILVVPIALLGSAAAIYVLPFGIDIYAQIGLILVIALASKNAILIVEFARDIRKQGKSIPDAAAEAARLRFRPILMTSFAFILGMVPLVVAEGAGASSRISLGATVLGGMVTSTFLAVLFVPTFFVVVQHMSEWWEARGQKGEQRPPAAS
ncbi:MAG: multidrug efflux RND transporter permease subunit [Planctomycetota bacterium]|nr:multidrug efflux RND transporter permease subunit [Planctomycetota bacterium]